MKSTELYYTKSEKLGLVFHKLCRRDSGVSLKAGVHKCDIKYKDDVTFLDTSIKISIKREGGEVVSVVSVSIDGGELKELSEKDLDSYVFDFKRKYIRITKSKGDRDHKGFSVICDSKTGEPIPTTGPVAHPGYMKKLKYPDSGTVIPIYYRVDILEKKKVWGLSIREERYGPWKTVPEKMFPDYEFCFI